MSPKRVSTVLLVAGGFFAVSQADATPRCGTSMGSSMGAPPRTSFFRPFSPGMNLTMGMRPQDPNDPKNPDRQQQFLRFLARQQALAFRQQILTARQQNLDFLNMMSYGSSSYGGSSYPMSYPMQLPANLGAGRQPAPAPAPIAGLNFLVGIVNDQGEVAWPVGLQVVAPALETKELRHKVESLLRNAAQQASQGRAPREMLDEAAKTTSLLRERLNEQRVGMPEATYSDAVAFLHRVQSALQVMRG